MKKAFMLKLLTLLIMIPPVMFGQQDSVRSYVLDPITVKSGLILEPQTIRKINLEKIRFSDANSLYEIAQYIPSVKLQNNSRGESLIYLRGSGERQISLFFDGVPLNIPWDNRINLGLLPTDAIQGIEITKGVPSIIYGTNSASGVVNVSSMEPRFEGHQGSFSTRIGENNHQKYSAYYTNGNEKTSFLISGSYATEDAYNLSSSFNNPTANPGNNRINSYFKSLTGYAKLKHLFSSSASITASLSYTNAEKGVPPEIDVANPRFWQYPEWNKLSGTLNGDLRIGNGNRSILAYTLSITKFDMQIDEFTGSDYSTINEVEINDDYIYFGRSIYTYLYGSNSIFKFVLTNQYSDHFEGFLSSNFSELKYSQNLFSGGGEYEYFDDNVKVILGLGIDGLSTPNTGDKESGENIWDFSINSALLYSFDNNYSAQINLGRKTRFPTLRETYSGALGRFVPNPELKAEVMNSGEIQFAAKFKNLTTDFSLFMNYLNDGIVRISLPGSQFQRVNKDQIRIIGFELTSSFRIDENTSADFNFTYMNSFAKSEDGSFSDSLEYKPNILAGFNLYYNLSQSLTSLVELNFVGEEYGLKEGDIYFQKLPDYVLANFRTGYNFNLFEHKSELYFRINNLFDNLYYTKWGLPEAGRFFRAGFTFNFK
ncbi:MAG: TonB-dependent receptor [Melioribacteraceae bacterium]|nr:TonB-dependent receptor [Melioribacteraceae bacterium]